MRPQSPFNVYVDTEAQVPGKEGASAALIAQFNQMLRGTLVFVDENDALYYKGSTGTYLSGNRIVLLSSGSGGVDGVDGIFSNTASLVAVGNLVAKGINPNSVVLADASDGTLPAFGVVVDVIDTLTCVVREFGECATITGGGAFTPGATVYLSETAGTATTTAPTTAGAVVQKIGVAKSATEVILGATPTFSASIYAQNGTDAQPSWSFAASPGTGAYRFDATSIAFSLGGVLAARMQTDGFGYIGTDAETNTDTNVLVLNHLSSGTTAAGFGTAIAFQVELPAGGAPVAMGKVSGGMAVATPGAEQGRVDIVPAFAGTLASVGIRTRAPSAAAALLNGLEVLPATNAAAVTSGVSIAPYAAATGSADVSLSLRPRGAGRTMLRDSGDTLTVLGVERVGSGALSGIVAWSSTATGVTSATLNATSGVVTFTDDAATTLTISNTLVTTSSLIFVNMQTATSNSVNIRRAVPTLDTITIELSGAPGATNYAIAFLVINPAA
jgi:hypothetical protein